MKKAGVSSASAICFPCWEFFILWSTFLSVFLSISLPHFPGFLRHTSLSPDQNHPSFTLGRSYCLYSTSSLPLDFPRLLRADRIV